MVSTVFLLWRNVMVILIGFILNEVLIELGGSVDTAFGNSLGMDSICVLSAFTVLKWFLDKLLGLGRYCYYAVLKDEKLCLLLSVLTGTITGSIIFALRRVIPHLYALTPEQYILFSKCLAVYSVGAVVHSVSDFLYVYLLYSNNMKLVYGTNLFYYAILFATDYVVVRKGLDLSALLACTVVCEVAHSLVIFAISDFRKTTCDFSRKNAITLIKHGSNMMFDRVTGKIATLFFQCFASRLGTELFAIHSVCYSVAVLMEAYTNALHVFALNRLSKVKGFLHKYKAHLWIFRKYGFLILSLVTVSILPALLLLHGSVPVKSCIPYVFVYCLDLVSLLFYEVSAGCLTSAQRTDILKFDGVIGIVVRIPIVLLTVALHWGPIGFAVSIILDFGSRALFNEVKMHQLLNKSV